MNAMRPDSIQTKEEQEEQEEQERGGERRREEREVDSAISKDGRRISVLQLRRCW